MRVQRVQQKALGCSELRNISVDTQIVMWAEAMLELERFYSWNGGKTFVKLVHIIEIFYYRPACTLLVNSCWSKFDSF
jgi:hypothetical protein